MINIKALGKFFYKFTCYFLAFMPLLFLCTIFYSKSVFGSVIGYKNMDYNNSRHLAFWNFTWSLYDVALICLLSGLPILIIYTIVFLLKQHKRNMKHLVIGYAGLLMLLFLVLSDPFNIWEYVSD